MDVKEKVWMSLDVSLGIVAILLFLSLLGIGLPNLGKVYALTYPGEAECFTGPEFGLVPLPFEQCCFEAMKLLYSEKDFVSEETPEKRYDYHFFNPDGPSIVMNSKAFVECRQKEYWIK